jgi:23S rRNA (cytidine2498-2'-O)-methyltransferase
MHDVFQTPYLFALANPGSEKALKLEVETMQLGWRLSYQRRGFVTFKADAAFGIDALDAPLACARRLCLSLGKAASRSGAIERIHQAGAEHGVDVPLIQQARYCERRMEGIPADPLPVTGQWVGTVVELGEAEFWAGLHRQGPGHCAYPAGDSGLVMPAESPSRAWLKLEEAVRFFGLDFTANDIVVELGCAPGGVVLALLNRGVSVIGVDPAKMAEVVMASAIATRDEESVREPWFYHCRKPAALVSKRDLGKGVTWFMSDMNQSPEVVLKECERFCRMAPSIRGVLITLKLREVTQVAEKSSWFETLRNMGFRTLRLQQLAVHHKEFALLARRDG